jgi:penicillin-binding protein 1A
VPGFDLAGKTGTTSDYKDAWFCGFTGGFTTVVWTGKDDNTPMRRITGGSAPAELWKTYMAKALRKLPVTRIPEGPPPPPPPIVAPTPQPAAITAPPQQGPAVPTPVAAQFKPS